MPPMSLAHWLQPALPEMPPAPESDAVTVGTPDQPGPALSPYGGPSPHGAPSLHGAPSSYGAQAPFGGRDLVAGPRRWWSGPLDVEGLATGSVGALLAAVDTLLTRRGDDRRATSTTSLVASAFGSTSLLRVNGKASPGFAPMSGYFPTGEGWLRVHANYPHHARVMAELFHATDPASMVRALRDVSAHDAEVMIRLHGGVAAALRTPGEWRRSAAGVAVDQEPWIEWTFDGPVTADMPERDGLPLAGVRVLDLTRVIAGPVAGRVLGALGAQVLRIDPPGLPELVDQHIDSNPGKRTALLDLHTRAGRQRLRELLVDADVVLTGYRPNALDATGLGSYSLRESYPGICHVSLSAWGTRGPWSAERGFDSVVQSAIGIGHLYGDIADEAHDDGDGRGGGGQWRPGVLPVQALDHATGYGMAAAAVALLARRPVSGAGSASLSLARTGHLLLDSPVLPAESVPLPHLTTTTTSSYGEIEQVPPPLIFGGRQLEFAWPARPYGEDPPAWLDPDHPSGT